MIRSWKYVVERVVYQRSTANRQMFSSLQQQTLSVEDERQLMKKKRLMTRYFNNQDYKTALNYAIKLQDSTAAAVGKNSVVYASSVNNVALMNKMLGNNTVAMDSYTEALQVYAQVQGKNSVNYASTLSNLGVLYRTMAEQSKGMDKLQLLERSEEALTDSRNIRMAKLGDTHKETLFSCLHLSGTLRLNGKAAEAESLLRCSLSAAKGAYGEFDTVVASLLNSLGLLLKHAKRFDEAKECYTQAISIQSEVLGDAHSEAITTRHNLAELFHVMGDETQAREVQEHILELLDVDPAEVAADEAAAAAAAGEQKEEQEQEEQEGSATDAESGSAQQRLSAVNDNNDGLAQQVANQARRISEQGPAAAGMKMETDEEIFGMSSMSAEDREARKKKLPPPPPLTFASRKNRSK